MILLDTDHFTALKYEDSASAHLLRTRMADSQDRHFAVTAITLEEQLRGWLAEIAATVDIMRQVGAYRRLVELVRFFGAWEIVPFDAEAAGLCMDLRKSRLRIGTMDLKIAAIARAHDVTLLSRNAVDFAKVQGLSLENWLD